MAREYYHITKNAISGWDFKKQSSEVVLKHESNKQDLIDYAANYCRERERQGYLSELVIHNADGTIADRRTYGDDPVRTVG
jgi:hypothetical protein